MEDMTVAELVLGIILTVAFFYAVGVVLSIVQWISRVFQAWWRGHFKPSKYFGKGKA